MNEQQIKDLVTNEINSAIAAHAKKNDWPTAMNSVLKPAMDGLTNGIAKGISGTVLTNEEIELLNRTIYAVNFLYATLRLTGAVGIIDFDSYVTPPSLPIPLGILPH
jgi:hypothetical protein